MKCWGFFCVCVCDCEGIYSFWCQSFQIEIFMGKRLPGNYYTKITECITFTTNTTKLNCNTNDKINMEFISISKWNTEFNKFFLSNSIFFLACIFVKLLFTQNVKILFFSKNVILNAYALWMQIETSFSPHREKKKVFIFGLVKPKHMYTAKPQQWSIRTKQSLSHKVPFWPMPTTTTIQFEFKWIVFVFVCTFFLVRFFVLALVYAFNVIFSWMFLFVMRAAVFGFGTIPLFSDSITQWTWAE